MDSISKERRSENMRCIRGFNTKPEMIVRRLCCELGCRGYRLHRKGIPGKPDLAWISRKLAIFVNGCFWHGHDCPVGLREPKSNTEYWKIKIAKNKNRDEAVLQNLSGSGWKVLVIWDCELKNLESVKERVQKFML